MVQQKNEFLFHDKQINKVIFPKYLVHVTSRENATNILKHGLTLGNKKTDELGKIRGVYLSNMPEYLHLRVRDPVGIVVDPKGLDLKFDPEFYPDWMSIRKSDGRTISEEINGDYEAIYVYSKKSIPKENIKGILKGDIYKIGKIRPSTRLEVI
jgi:hypothetical protein